MDWKKIAGGLILVIGVFAFILSISNNNLHAALIYITATLIIWVLYGLLADVFDVRIFSGVISISGFIVALSVFFMFGVEEIPYPVGAIIFHSEGIASALGIVLFSMLPLLIIHQLNAQNVTREQEHVTREQEQMNGNNEDFSKGELANDDWEIVSEEELMSGDFEA